MKFSRTCVLLLVASQLGTVTVSCGAEPKFHNSETDGNAIFAAIADRYRKTERLRIVGKLKVVSGAEAIVTKEQFEIIFSRGKEIYVKVGDLKTTSPAILGYEKSFRIKDGKAFEYFFGVEAKQYESGQKEFLQSNFLNYRLVPATLPSLLLLDESMFFSNHLHPSGWEIENTDELPENEVILKLRWVKGDTFIKVCLRDRKLLECKFQFRLAGLKSASFEFGDESSW